MLMLPAMPDVYVLGVVFIPIHTLSIRNTLVLLEGIGKSICYEWVNFVSCTGSINVVLFGYIRDVLVSLY